ncbi:MAG: hypothetical protein BJ554DRAFT_4324 [Olpidium bornovanus]|uniref:Uncharacterized protein n=1 Tax=Olpidium bornovanus TaxID=278681 RepID=A0A8H7ZMY1_9FUNG|nr:MAG: hypothetical protein BJ554DRAFT_4324 [Olpidium bornovanus]
MRGETWPDARTGDLEFEARWSGGEAGPEGGPRQIGIRNRICRSPLPGSSAGPLNKTEITGALQRCSYTQVYL